ncbi:DUF4352 domain-containing protein [Nocardiopsis salina]|uniref:DUF4352 domain-containing protein n=1 Tax=Nocardiopsis salina TaxID=245836 RepID=UPI000477609E|nr:DUF4352 domain-containing protein [Nocardiopsis salina]
MSESPAPPPAHGGGGPGRRSSKIALAVAVPLSVFFAGVLCLATVIALTTLVTRTAEPGPGQGAEAPAQGTDEPEPERDPGAGQERDEEPGTPDPDQRSSEEGTSQAPGHTVPEVPPGSYDGTSTWLRDFRVECETAYTDTTITDGMGASQTAPSGSEFHIYRLHVTNEGDVPDLFDTFGTTATTTDGREFTHDEEAEFTVAWDYLWDEINPGETVTTYVVLTAPEGTRFAEVRIAGEAVLEPVT